MCFLPGTGRGTAAVRRWWRGWQRLRAGPSTMLRMVPLPVPGRVSRRAEIRRQQPGIDAGALEGGGPARVDVAFVEELVASRGGEPAVAAQFLLELPRSPARIAERDGPAARP